ncbi:MAG: hypothetical protein FWH40_06560 [Coriobacteriia bacterium]|nr:hypothetical protein [Coriobacteriia bacterium]
MSLEDEIRAKKLQIQQDIEKKKRADELEAARRKEALEKQKEALEKKKREDALAAAWRNSVFNIDSPSVFSPTGETKRLLETMWKYMTFTTELYVGAAPDGSVRCCVPKKQYTTKWHKSSSQTRVTPFGKDRSAYYITNNNTWSTVEFDGYDVEYNIKGLAYGDFFVINDGTVARKSADATKMSDHIKSLVEFLTDDIARISPEVLLPSKKFLRLINEAYNHLNYDLELTVFAAPDGKLRLATSANEKYRSTNLAVKRVRACRFGDTYILIDKTIINPPTSVTILRSAIIDHLSKQ